MQSIILTIPEGTALGEYRLTSGTVIKIVLRTIGDRDYFGETGLP
jgi:hypothetical protein